MRCIHESFDHKAAIRSLIWGLCLLCSLATTARPAAASSVSLAEALADAHGLGSRLLLQASTVSKPAGAAAAAPPAAGASSAQQQIVQGKPGAKPAGSNPSPVSTMQRGPPCTWDTSEQSCNPTHEAWLLAGPGLPSSPFRKAVMMSATRDKWCDQYKAAPACNKDIAHRCFWQGLVGSSKGSCESSDMQEVLLFAAKAHQPNMSTIPHSMTCPGSQARTFYECYAHAGALDSCRALPQCMVLEQWGAAKDICVPSSFGKQPLGKLRVLLQGLEDLKPSVYGSCEAACWLQQSEACGAQKTAVQCAKLPFCEYKDPATDKQQKSNIWGDEDNESDATSSSSSPGSSGGSSGSGSIMSSSSSSSRVAAAKALKPTPCRHVTEEFVATNAVDIAAQAIYKKCRAAASATACSRVVVKQRAGTHGRQHTPGAAAAGDLKNLQPSAAAVKCQLPGKSKAATKQRQ